MTQQPTIRLRSIALPTEHGAWGFLGEPALLGLLVAPTLSGVFLVIAALGAFLARHPLRIAAKDALKSKFTRRSGYAAAFATGFGLLALIAFGLAYAFAPGPQFLLVLLLAAPLAIVQVGMDAANRSRDLIAELSGALALGALPAAMSLLFGRDLYPSLMLWGIVAGRVITSIPYVRARLRRMRKQKTPAWPVMTLHIVTLGVLLLLAAQRWLPYLALGGFVVLAVRAGYGLSAYAGPARAQDIGIQEVIYGLVVVAFAALGYWLGA